MRAQTVLVLQALVAAAFAVLLLWRSPRMTMAVYRVGFFFGLAVLAATFFSMNAGQNTWDFRLPDGPTSFLGLIPITFLASAPFILLIESGISGYRGFSSWIRYLSLLIAATGALGLVASFVLPRVLRR